MYKNKWRSCARFIIYDSELAPFCANDILRDKNNLKESNFSAKPNLFILNY